MTLARSEKMPTMSVRRRISRLSRSCGVVRPDPAPDGLGERGEREHVGAGQIEVLGNAGQGGAERGDQAAVRVGGDQPHPAQAWGGEAAEERQPAGAVLAGGDVQAEYLAVPVAVDPGRQQGVPPGRRRAPSAPVRRPTAVFETE